jgi:hypothetical protein
VGFCGTVLWDRPHSLFRADTRQSIAILIFRRHTDLCPFRRFGDLFAGHFFFDFVATFSSNLVAIGTGNIPPHVRGSRVLQNALAIDVFEAKIVLRIGLALLSGKPIPAHCLFVALRYPPRRRVRCVAGHSRSSVRGRNAAALNVRKPARLRASVGGIWRGWVRPITA